MNSDRASLLDVAGAPLDHAGRVHRHASQPSLLVRRAHRRRAARLEDEQLPGPKVLAGSDAGAVLAAALAADLHADAVILAGLALPDGDGPDPDDTFEHELELRTACPAHRGVLTG